MSLTVYIMSVVSVFFFSGLMAMAGLGAAFIFVPLFYEECDLAECNQGDCFGNLFPPCLRRLPVGRGVLRCA